MNEDAAAEHKQVEEVAQAQEQVAVQVHRQADLHTDATGTDSVSVQRG